MASEQTDLWLTDPVASRDWLQLFYEASWLTELMREESSADGYILRTRATAQMCALAVWRRAVDLRTDPHDVPISSVLGTLAASDQLEGRLPVAAHPGAVYVVGRPLDEARPVQASGHRVARWELLRRHRPMVLPGESDHGDRGAAAALRQLSDVVVEVSGQQGTRPPADTVTWGLIMREVVARHRAAELRPALLSLAPRMNLAVALAEGWTPNSREIADATGALTRLTRAPLPLLGESADAAGLTSQLSWLAGIPRSLNPFAGRAVGPVGSIVAMLAAVCQMLATAPDELLAAWWRTSGEVVWETFEFRAIPPSLREQIREVFAVVAIQAPAYLASLLERHAGPDNPWVDDE